MKFYSLILILLCTYTPKKSKKVIYEKGAQITLYVVYDTPSIKAKENISYSWYKNQSIKTTRSTYIEPLLHGSFQKHDRSSNLLVLGRYNYGRKDSIWTYFNKEGDLILKEDYRKGLLDGSYTSYLNDTVLEKGRYRRGKKTGKWLDNKAKETLYFVNGQKREVKENWLKRKWKKWFGSKQRDSIYSSDLPLIEKADTLLIINENIRKKDSLEALKKSNMKKSSKYEVKTVDGRKKRYRKNN
jgi:hypothetical protein